jgi:DNA-binding transcriptional ArsR family regulator
VEKDIFQSEICAERLKALADPLRLRIIDTLRHGEKSVGEISEQLATEIVTVSHHLQILKHAHLVNPRREGRYMFYSLPDSLVDAKEDSHINSINLGCCKIEVPETVVELPDSTKSH